jgi:hypothetical protein
MLSLCCGFRKQYTPRSRHVENEFTDVGKFIWLNRLTAPEKSGTLVPTATKDTWKG